MNTNYANTEIRDRDACPKSMQESNFAMNAQYVLMNLNNSFMYAWLPINNADIDCPLNGFVDRY